MLPRSLPLGDTVGYSPFMRTKLATTLDNMVFGQQAVREAIESVKTNGTGMQHFPEHGSDRFSVLAMLSRDADEFMLLVVIHQGQTRQSGVQLALTTLEGGSVSQLTRDGLPLFKLGTTPEKLIGARLSLATPGP